ncbi:hypothetical protein NVP1103O_32 [Vibrio phage 1.103.O._10N.261.52.F2]|nr:hypothetical protein NVP1103O_32 [Vibrio phage 1.103.O._10N.261.52.F2]
MKTIKITEEMFNTELDDARALYLFLGVSEEIIDDEMWFFKEGEELEWDGFMLGESERGQSLLVGDVLIKHNNKIKVIKSDIAFLVHDSLKADEYEKLLNEIYESGQLDAPMVDKYRQVMVTN